MCQNCHLQERFEKESFDILCKAKEFKLGERRDVCMNILVTENLKKYYDMGEVQVKALDGISLSIQSGEFLAIVGSSGSAFTWTSPIS